MMTVNTGPEQEWKKGEEKPNDMSDFQPFTQQYRGRWGRDVWG